MKNKILFCLLLSAFCLPAPAGPVYFPLLDMTGATNDTTVNVKALNNPIVYNNNFYTLPRDGTNLITVNGVVTNTFVPGIYTVSVAGLPKTWRIYVTNNTEAVSAVDLSREIVRYSGVQSVAGNGVTSDGLGNVTVNIPVRGVAAGDNVTIVTNGAVVTISSTGGGGGGSGETNVLESVGALTSLVAGKDGPELQVKSLGVNGGMLTISSTDTNVQVVLTESSVLNSMTELGALFNNRSNGTTLNGSVTINSTLNVTDFLAGSVATFSGNVTSTGGSFIGDGSLLTSLNSGQLTGTIPDARVGSWIARATNVVERTDGVATNLSLYGTTTAAAINAGTVTGNASGLTNANASTFFGSGTIPDARFPAVIPGTALMAYSNSVGQSLSSPFRRVFNVLDYGADPTGTLPCATNIQLALEAAGAAGGGIVYVPAGTYEMGQHIGKPGFFVESGQANITMASNNVTLMGAGMGVSTLRRGNPDGTGDVHTMLNSALTTNIAILNLTLDGSYGDVTQIHSNYLVFFRNVEIKNSRHAEGFDTDGSVGVWVIDCIGYNNGGGHISFGGPPFGGGDWFIHGFRGVIGGTNDLGLVEDWSAIGVKNDVGIVSIRDVSIENSPVALTTLSQTRIFVSGLTVTKPGTTSTNIFHQGGHLTIEDSEFSSTGNGGTWISGSGNLTVRNSRFSNRVVLWHDNKLYLDFEGNTVTSAIADHPLKIRGGGFHKIRGNRFNSAGYSAVRFQSDSPVTNSVISGNTFESTSLHLDGGSSNNLVAANVFRGGGILVWGSAARNDFVDNHIIGGNYQVGAGSANNRVFGGRVDTIDFQSGQSWEFHNLVLNSTTVAASSGINASLWHNIRAPDLTAWRNWTVTTNYTADGIDTTRVLIFNGSNITNTIPSAATLNRRQQFTIKNIHSTALEVTNATGSQTFDGALRFSLPQYASRVIVSDGANWQTVSSHTP
jgi:hypothetical protein